jgi:predicted nucleic acid-binding protein
MKKTRLYLDVCCFNRPFDDQSQPLIWMETQAILLIKDEIEKEILELVWSYILDWEIGKNPDVQMRNAVFKWRKLATGKVNESKLVLKTAAEIQESGVKLNDSLHVACAIAAECDYFLSTDKRLLKKPVSGIVLLNPLDFIQFKESIK